MNAPFDAEAVAAAGVQQADEGQGPLVLWPKAPLESARQLIRRRYTLAAGHTLHHQQGTFYVWSGTHYREADRDEIRAVSMSSWTARGNRTVTN